MSKAIPGGKGFFGGRREVVGGRAGRAPGRGFSSSATIKPHQSNSGPKMGFGMGYARRGPDSRGRGKGGSGRSNPKR